MSLHRPVNNVQLILQMWDNIVAILMRSIINTSKLSGYNIYVSENAHKLKTPSFATQTFILIIVNGENIMEKALLC